MSQPSVPTTPAAPTLGADAITSPAAPAQSAAGDKFYGHQLIAEVAERMMMSLFSCARDSMAATPDARSVSSPDAPRLAHFVAYALYRTRLPMIVTYYAFVLLRRLKQRFPVARGSSGHRLFISAFMLATKMVCDDAYNNKSWTIVGQGLFSLQEVNQMERELLGYLGLAVNVTREELASIAADLVEFGAPVVTLNDLNAMRLRTPRRPVGESPPRAKRTSAAPATPRRRSQYNMATLRLDSWASHTAAASGMAASAKSAPATMRHHRRTGSEWTTHPAHHAAAHAGARASLPAHNSAPLAALKTAPMGDVPVMPPYACAHADTGESPMMWAAFYSTTNVSNISMATPSTLASSVRPTPPSSVSDLASPWTQPNYMFSTAGLPPVPPLDPSLVSCKPPTYTVDMGAALGSAPPLTSFGRHSPAYHKDTARAPICSRDKGGVRECRDAPVGPPLLCVPRAPARRLYGRHPCGGPRRPMERCARGDAHLSLGSESSMATLASVNASEKDARLLFDSSDTLCESALFPCGPATLCGAVREKHEAAFARVVAERVPRHVTSPTLRRTVRRMYQWLPRRYTLAALVPAVVLAVVTGGIPVAMTHVVGRAFAAFVAFDPAQRGADAALRSSILVDVYTLLGLAAGTLLMRSAMVALWMYVGDRGAQGWQAYVYRSVARNPAAWFDLGMGLDGAGPDGAGDMGAGGLMGLYVRDADDIRYGMGFRMGTLVHSAAAMLASAVFALMRSWKLALVIFAILPLLVVATAVGEVLAAPLQAADRARAASLSALLDRGVALLPTLKAFGAQDAQARRLAAAIARCRSTYMRLSCVWAVRLGVVSTLGLLTFVQGFAYGSYLVRHGQATPATVLSTFLASLVAMGQLQSILLQLALVEKGKVAAAKLEELATSYVAAGERGAAAPRAPPPASTVALAARQGEVTLQHVWMAYPARPDTLVLRNVNMFFAAAEHTYILGESGSGKSSIAQLLLRAYEPQAGFVCLDGVDVCALSPAWYQAQVAGVAQHAFVLDGSVEANLRAAGAADRIPDACRVMQLDDVVRALPHGLATRIGRGGVELSGGQKQRLALARAFVRDPLVLVLDEATSALDSRTATAVQNAVRTWRTGRTTIIITHDARQVAPHDYCYLMADGGNVGG
ncbi:ABC-type xenobiotic transporter [Malassezia sp. CBS 17886]|nr:ABC-type xenobiotic transporter [Malassezia sp. CBS 17886]